MKFHHRVIVILLSCGLLTSLQAQSSSAADAATQEVVEALEVDPIYQSVIRIEVATQNPDYETPWNAGRFSGGTGTGFLIGDNQFLTNAHVVSNARRILVTKHGSSRKHPARVVHIAHDCDLALLEIQDFSSFQDLPHLPIGGVPKLESQVRVIGYPVGGERISITRGVVSRIDFSTYSHSRSDSHIVVQIDAAINPGNSGGPVLQEGKVVGVAFQGLTQADNTGYMIPTPVVKRFLTDIEDGTYDQYVELGASTFDLDNPAMRKHYKLGNDDPGVLVTDVLPDSSVDGVLKRGDILTKIDGKTIDSSGSVLFAGERVNMSEVVERKFVDDTVTFEILREGKTIEATATLKTFPPAKLYSVEYGKTPRFTTQAGLVFQPLNLNLYAAHKFDSTRVRKLMSGYLTDKIYTERKDIVILTKVLADPINSSIQQFAGNAVAKINGTTVTSLQQAHDLLHPDNLPDYFEIELEGIDRPLIISTESLKKANQRIQQSYGINNTFQLQR